MNIKALYKLGYGIYVVASKKDDRINGQIANTQGKMLSRDHGITPAKAGQEGFPYQ